MARIAGVLFGRFTNSQNFPGICDRFFRVPHTSDSEPAAWLFSDETLKANLFGTHSSYSTRPITSMGYVANSSDMVMNESGLSLSDAVLDYAMQSDGAMLMWKAITVS